MPPAPQSHSQDFRWWYLFHMTPFQNPDFWQPPLQTRFCIYSPYKRISNAQFSANRYFHIYQTGQLCKKIGVCTFHKYPVGNRNYYLSIVSARLISYFLILTRFKNLHLTVRIHLKLTWRSPCNLLLSSAEQSITCHNETRTCT